MRIVTRPDFDGVVCAVLLKEVLGWDTPLIWVQPNEIQNGTIPTDEQDVIANLPLNGPCALWFDHHVSNVTQRPYKGLFQIAPSAARLVNAYYSDQLGSRFAELVRQTDKIDSAQLSLDEILHPEHYPFILLSMTIGINRSETHSYCDHLVRLLKNGTIEHALKDAEVTKRCGQVVKINRSYETALKKHTTMRGSVSISDFRGVLPTPEGNRFLVYCLFPEAVVNIKVFEEPPWVAIKLGHSIVNPGCNVNVGQLLALYGGGGHRGAGACRIDPHQADRCLHEIIEILIQNEPNDRT